MSEPERPPQIDPELVAEFVLQAHMNLDRVQELLEQAPRLVNCSYDWGGGDWESGLGAAAHMGRRDIAEYLLAHGARIDIFAAAMLGLTDVVRAAIEASPETLTTLGPHGITLIQHAKAGGEQGRGVLALLESAARV